MVSGSSHSEVITKFGEPIWYQSQSQVRTPLGPSIGTSGTMIRPGLRSSEGSSTTVKFLALLPQTHTKDGQSGESPSRCSCCWVSANMSAEKITSRNCLWIHDSPSRYPSCEGPHTTVPPASSRWVVETGRKEPRKKLNSAGTVVLSVMTSGSPALRSGGSLISDMSDSNSASV